MFAQERRVADAIQTIGEIVGGGKWPAAGEKKFLEPREGLTF